MLILALQSNRVAFLLLKEPRHVGVKLGQLILQFSKDAHHEVVVKYQGTISLNGNKHIVGQVDYSFH